MRRSKKRSVILNVTSLIDVLFLLLIFFMISTTFLSQPAIKMELPKAEHSDVVRQKPLVVYIDQSGKVFLNDEPMEIPLLEEALRRKLQDTTDKSLVLKADSRVSHGSVVEVLDIVKGAGVQKLVVSTRFKE
ncbi:MAG: biopolymer transporter ExbD [Candidatus Latescibacteria bacterium]|nr:biopolymer transporter ExbD [Candidatus Latescibacterota bacterium]NIO02957.1 biopolymer transporter ExbD [Candidatus Latescibacterota bacterium]NIO30092.1 biopolymer transporter ExbD [Candidatus Latescibacterota bacterium]NIO57711.1 biopolymer transporter ExbD [Candidatus Latescibacterota bacterium]NIT03246.1 biopolymer transporter ExbD [Candidatus Latescibacterota bacterium]